MVLEITSCLCKEGDKAIYDALVQLGLTIAIISYEYVSCTIIFHGIKQLPVRSNTGGRPAPSQHESRPSFEVTKGRLILEELDKAPQTKSNVRKQVRFLGVYF